MTAAAVACICSQIDGVTYWHDSSQAFAPFSAESDGPALYLGFSGAFPPREWITLVFDVDETSEAHAASARVFWQYWNGARWAPLHATDGTDGLRVRGYLGFFAPPDQQSSQRFGQAAYWLRVWMHRDPTAEAGPDRVVVAAANQEANVTLDAGFSRAYESQVITKYLWRLLPSGGLIANAGPDQVVTTTGAEAAITLDASASEGRSGRPIQSYHWRNVTPVDEGYGPARLLKTIRVNTVTATNAITVSNETLGSGNGQPDQVVRLTRPPVFPGSVVAVREPDSPDSAELDALNRELRRVDSAAEALLTVSGTLDPGVWVRWVEVNDFTSSTPASRHYTLDPITGAVCFGDGRRGKCPPVGRNNIRAVAYRTHHGSQGNVPAGSVTVVRNPAGPLAQIRRAANIQAAAGGSDAETVERVRQRGPQSLKHGQRAVTVEDYGWLAQGVSGEVYRAWCLPSRNVLGQREAGWVTVIIIPSSPGARPTPSPALLRKVEAYLNQCALANLSAANHIVVVGPQYIEVTVTAQIVPREPEKADVVERDVLARLEVFLHPLTGGPDRQGWMPGRDVQQSEIYAELEAVAGVDHVAGLRLESSGQQQHILLSEPLALDFEARVGSQVSTFDDRVRLRLADAIESTAVPSSLSVYGFKAGDKVMLVRHTTPLLSAPLTIARVESDTIHFTEGIAPLSEKSDHLVLESLNESLRLPLQANGFILGDGRVVGVKTAGLGVDGNTRLSIVTGNLRRDFVRFSQIEPEQDRAFVAEGQLVCSGPHRVEMVVE